MTLDQQQRLEYFVGTEVHYTEGNKAFFTKYSFPDHRFVEDLFDEIVVDVEPPQAFMSISGYHYCRQKKPRLTFTVTCKNQEIVAHIDYLVFYYSHLNRWS